MFNNDKGLQRRVRYSRRLIAFGPIIGLVFLSVTAQADTTAQANELKPETRDTVRAVGQAVLRAKRTYTPDPAAVALQDDVKAARESVKALAEPSPNTPIRIQSAGARSTAPSMSPETAWRQARAADIGRLRSAVANVRNKSRTLREKAVGVQRSSPSFLDSIMNYFTGKQSRTVGKRTAIVTPVTTHALTRLEGLDTEIEAALVLPAAERQQRLRDLIAILSPGGASPQLHDVDEKPASPTMTTRTQHRRAW